MILDQSTGTTGWLPNRPTRFGLRKNPHFPCQRKVIVHTVVAMAMLNIEATTTTTTWHEAKHCVHRALLCPCRWRAIIVSVDHDDYDQHHVRGLWSCPGKRVHPPSPRVCFIKYVCHPQMYSHGFPLNFMTTTANTHTHTHNSLLLSSID